MNPGGTGRGAWSRFADRFIPRSVRQQGVDAVQLTRKDGRWLIASILNEIPTPSRPIPDILRGGG